MHLDFANLLNLVSTITLIGALVFTGLQVRAANRARREQAAVTVIETAALSENSARFLELLSEIPEGASAAVIENLDARNEAPDLFSSDFGWKSSATWFFTVWWMFKPLTILPVARSSVSGRAQKAGRRKGESARAHDEFLEWCEWLATQIAQYRATRPYVPAYSRVGARHGTVPTGLAL